MKVRGTELKKKMIVSLLGLSMALLAPTSNAFAAIDGYVAKNKQETVYYYDLKDLVFSSSAYLGDENSNEAKLWKHFIDNQDEIVSLHDSKKGFVKFMDVFAEYQKRVLVEGDSTFDIDAYTESDSPGKASLPSIIKKVKLNTAGGTVTEEDYNPNDGTNPPNPTDDLEVIEIN